MDNGRLVGSRSDGVAVGTLNGNRMYGLAEQRSSEVITLFAGDLGVFIEEVVDCAVKSVDGEHVCDVCM